MGFIAIVCDFTVKKTISIKSVKAAVGLWVKVVFSSLIQSSFSFFKDENPPPPSLRDNQFLMLYYLYIEMTSFETMYKSVENTPLVRLIGTKHVPDCLAVRALYWVPTHCGQSNRLLLPACHAPKLEYKSPWGGNGGPEKFSDVIMHRRCKHAGAGRGWFSGAVFQCDRGRFWSEKYS